MQEIKKNIRRILIKYSFKPYEIKKLQTNLEIRQYKNGALIVKKIK
jgi:hypothetical protein